MLEGLANSCLSIDVTNSREGSAEDVVTLHRQRNRAPRLPSNTQLAAVRHQQRAASMTASSQHEAPQLAAVRHQQRAASVTASSQHEAPQVPEFEAHAEPSRQRSHVGSTAECADPSQLQFYEPAVRDIIERAKQFSRCDAASINAFPHRTEFNKHASEYVEEAVHEREARSLIVPLGKHTYIGTVQTVAHCLSIVGWWPQYRDDICKLVRLYFV